MLHIIETVYIVLAHESLYLISKNSTMSYINTIGDDRR
jgi:hypothetical protein